MTKKEKIKNHLLRYKTITSWTAFKRYHSLRLGAIIFELKNEDGMNIVGRWIKPKHGENYYEYRLITNEKELIECNMNHIPRID